MDIQKRYNRQEVRLILKSPSYLSSFVRSIGKLYKSTSVICKFLSPYLSQTRYRGTWILVKLRQWGDSIHAVTVYLIQSRDPDNRML